MKNGIATVLLHKQCFDRTHHLSVYITSNDLGKHGGDGYAFHVCTTAPRHQGGALVAKWVGGLEKPKGKEGNIHNSSKESRTTGHLPYWT